MAKGLIYLDGIDNIIDDLNAVVESVEKEAKTGLEDSLLKIEKRMKSNANSAFTDGYTKGIMVRSISHVVSSKDDVITGSVGVYDMSNKTGTSARKIPEPIIAYWYEFGIQPHSTAVGARAEQKGRKAKRQSGNPHPGSEAKGFMSSAFDSLSGDILEDLVKNINNSIERKK